MCTNDQIKKIRGCKEPLHIPVWVKEDYKFFNCPLSYLSLQIKQWYNKYKFIKDNICTRVDYKNEIAKFFDAINTYEYYYNKFTKEKLTKDKQDPGFRQLKEMKQWQQKKSNTA